MLDIDETRAGTDSPNRISPEKNDPLKYFRSARYVPDDLDEKTEVIMRTFYTAIVTAAVVLIYSLWTDERSIAASRFTDDIAELARIANMVIEVEVIDVESVFVTGTQVPMTQSHLRIVKTYKGSTIETNLCVEYPGGNDGAQRTIASGQPSLTAGGHYVLFLARFSPSKQWSIVGGDAGQVELVSDSDGMIAQRVGRPGFEYFVQDNKSLSGTSRVNCSIMREGDFRDLLETIIVTGRPVVATAASAVQRPVSMHQQNSTLSDSVATPLFVRILITLTVVSLIWLVGTRCVAK